MANTAEFNKWITSFYDESESDDAEAGETDDEEADAIADAVECSVSDESETSDVEDPETFLRNTGVSGAASQQYSTAGLLSNASISAAAPNQSLHDIENTDPVTFWELIFSQEMLEIILKYTNMKLASERKRLSDPRRVEYKDCATTELKAFLGLLIYTAVFKSNHENISSLFSKDGSGRDIFKVSMSSKRFITLLLYMRFDNPTEKGDRSSLDAGVDGLINLFNKNSQASLSPGTCTTIDSMLVPFRGSCAFKTCKQRQRQRYGLSVPCLADSVNGYVYNVYVYTGDKSHGVGLTDAEQKYSVRTQCALRLCRPIFGRKCNVTGNAWFSSFELIQALKDRGLTYVGSLKKKQRAEDVAQHDIDNIATIVSHSSKRGKELIYISSMHSSRNIVETGVPEIVEFYNATKGAVDALEKTFDSHTTSRRAKRWSMAVFYRVVDMSLLNSYILQLYHKDSRPMKRLDFMKVLGKQLVTPYLQERLYNLRLPRQLRLTMETILGLKPESVKPVSVRLLKRKCCYLCAANKRRKTSTLCTACGKPVCLQCSSPICVVCSNRDIEE